MANIIREILDSDKKHKEKVVLITEKVGDNKELISQLFEILQNGSDVEKGNVAEVLKFVSNERPETMLQYIDIIVEYIDYKASRVKWGCPESIGNIARKYPYDVEKAIPKLFRNYNDKSTVVRWCAAYALSEIAKYNLKRQNELVQKFKEFVKTEKNNGVRNVFIKAIKEIDKMK